MRAAFLSASAVVVVIGLADGATASWAQGPEELWVVLRGTGEIGIVDIEDSRLKDTIDISDPDGDGQPDPPWGIAMSTAISSRGAHAFVTQEGFLRVLEVASRREVGNPVDVAALLQEPGLVLRGCDAAAPRVFRTSSGAPEVRAFLYVAATTAAGQAKYVILDQDALLATAADPIVESGALLQSGTALDVIVQDVPAGDAFQRAWFGVTREGRANDDILAIRLAKGNAVDQRWQIAERNTFPLDAGQVAPDVLGLGVPDGKELPVLPLSRTGRLENLYVDGRCDTGGDLVDVAVVGPGANSYTVLAVDRAAKELVVVDPGDCSTRRFAVGTDPTTVTTLGRVVWQSAFVTNRGDDTVTRLDVDGTLTTISMCRVGETCGAKPSGAGVALVPVCAVVSLETDTVDADEPPDGIEDDILLTWDSAPCIADQEFTVWCQCPDNEPDCPCYCDCMPPPPGCYCPGVQDLVPPSPGFSFGSTDLDIVLLPPPWPPIPQSNPWKKLGLTADQQFIHEGQAITDPFLSYGVTVGDEGP